MTTRLAPLLPRLSAVSPAQRATRAARRHALLRGLLVVGGLSAGVPALAATPTGAPVATAVAQAGNGSRVQQLDGVLQPVNQATLAAQVGGNVVQLAVKPGDVVRAGQLVARVDARETQAAVAGSEAGVAQAEAQWRNAQQQAERTRALRQQGFMSQAAQDQTDAALRAAQAALQQAQAGRQQATLARGFAVINAPFDAVVLATHVQTGDLATPGRPIATLYQPGLLRAVVQVPASWADTARQARQVQVQLSDGRRLSPTASQLLPTADAVSQTVEWRLTLPAAEAGSAALLPGQAVRVSWAGAAAADAGTTGNTSAAPLLPPAAVLQRGELTAVYVVRNDQFVLRAVRTGVAQATGVPVLAGLKPGERYALNAVAAGLAGAVPAAPAAAAAAQP